MDAEIIKFDQEGKQIILNYHRYQKNENKSDSNQIEHYHSQMSQCEVDCLVQLKILMQLVSVDHNIRLEEAHNRYYQLLTERFSALALVPLKDVKAGRDIILDNIPIPLDEDILKFINYFVKNWVKGKYGSAWNHFDNSGPRTNNHHESYHSKLSSLPSKTNNVLTFINMIKKSATQVYNDISVLERNPIEPPRQLSKNKNKDKIFILLQEQYNENELTFAQYFDKLTSHIIDPYGINTFKYSEDHENEEKIDKVGQKRRRKIVFVCPFENENFLERVDFSNLVIKQTADYSSLFTKE
ncbi:hypothetical protein BpHYR1_048247 [Brachionus plicatilis]|uniref:Uncharacterized protein n=1 Tax=Brachionus plicatilis TaxID=10195 RepID=A0A3M7PAE1_BRAPC|nr:hypothetical protein BpHYR1_048247 [Brachionus plicatilis]